MKSYHFVSGKGSQSVCHSTEMLGYIVVKNYICNLKNSPTKSWNGFEHEIMKDYDIKSLSLSQG